jgi:hypothetical protein
MEMTMKTFLGAVLVVLATACGDGSDTSIDSDARGVEYSLLDCFAAHEGITTGECMEACNNEPFDCPEVDCSCNDDVVPEEEEETGNVEVCHVPPGNPDNAHTITVGAASVDAHLRHGDSVGPCGSDDDGAEGDDDGDGGGGGDGTGTGPVDGDDEGGGDGGGEDGSGGEGGDGSEGEGGGEDPGCVDTGSGCELF